MDSERRLIHRSTGLEVFMGLDEDGNYCAWVPALPGCVAGAETGGETLADLALGIEAVLDVIRQDEPDRYKRLVGAATTVTAPLTLEASVTQPVYFQSAA